MKNTLSHQQNIQNLIHSIIRGISLIFFFTPMCVYAQQSGIDNGKKILYLSYVFDEVSLNNYLVESYFEKCVTNADSCYRVFEYNCSRPLHLHFSKREEILTDNYTVQLFKIPRSFYPYYLLYFNSSSSSKYRFYDNLWIRVAGYAENDLKIFFDVLKEMGMSVENIYSMVDDWCQRDSIFAELDWNCLIEGYEKKDTHRDCYISSIFDLHYRACVNCWYSVVGKNIYSSFSRIIFLGNIDLHY